MDAEEAVELIKSPYTELNINKLAELKNKKRSKKQIKILSL